MAELPGDKRTWVAGGDLGFLFKRFQHILNFWERRVDNGMIQMERQSTVHFSPSHDFSEPQSLLKHIPLEELQRFQDTFADTHGVSFQIMDPHGNLITMPSNELPACRLFHKSPRAEAECMACIHSAAMLIKRDNRLFHQKKCPLGVLAVAAPVFFDDIHVANLCLRKPCILPDTKVTDIDLSYFLGLDAERLRTELEGLEICGDNDLTNVEAWLNSFIRQMTSLDHLKASHSYDSGAMEDRDAELERYRAKMEDLVNERTADLISTNKRLQLEVLERDLVEEQIERKSKLIDAINQVLKQTLSEQEEINLYRTFLRTAREITGSKFGFIVERQNSRWEVTALSSTYHYEHDPVDGHRCEPFDIRGVWQEVVDGGDAMFVKNPESRLDWQPLPSQFPTIENLLAVPLLKDGHALGLVAVANSDDTYSPVDSDDIKALAQAFMGALVRKRMELAKFQSEKRLNLAMDSANQGLWDYFPQSGYLYFSPSWFTMLGYHAHEFPTSLETWTTLTHPNDVADLEMALEAVARGDEKSFGIEIRMLGKEGHWRWINALGRAVEHDHDNAVSRIVGTLSDISKYKRVEMALQKANEELQRLAALDDLTQIANRRRFDDRLTQEWRRARRENKPLALLICDIDFFKYYNDTYGHLKGDDTLHIVAQAISDMLKRPMDLVARYGGEEFAAILPNTNIKGAMRVAHELKAGIDALKIEHRASDVADHITLSFGVAALVPSAETQPKALIEAADKALYKAKALGRNTIVKNYGKCSEDMPDGEAA